MELIHGENGLLILVITLWQVGACFGRGGGLGPNLPKVEAVDEQGIGHNGKENPPCDRPAICGGHGEGKRNRGGE